MKNFYLLVFLVFCFTATNLYGKVLIITHAYNRPDFIEIQHKTFKKFLKDDYEFVVFNDSERNKQNFNIINNVCKRLGIACITIPQAIHDKPYLKRWPEENWNSPSVRTSNAIQFSLNILGFDYNGIVAIIDSDMFLLKEFSITDYLQGNDIAGHPQSRGSDVHYLWNGIVFLNMNTLPNKKTLDFNCGKVDNQPVDSGGQTHHFFKNHPTVKVKYLNYLYIAENNTEFFIDKTFLHYRGGANWDNKSPEYHSQKTKWLNNLIDTALAQ